MALVQKLAGFRFPTYVLNPGAAPGIVAATLRAGPCRVVRGDESWWVAPIGNGETVEVRPLHVDGPSLVGRPEVVVVGMDSYVYPPPRTVRRGTGALRSAVDRALQELPRTDALRRRLVRIYGRG